ncbi:arylamine N-acetyltransferase 3 [Thelonectria olida]|uniref:Arylamine N-acetyltransferase 3 n=1 Tax=Thelonectria olida TaxID=1576542 RepID=A0A9P9AQ55_9HYPO|nr:arylamine N-acetyltransferase 3 [Thelonectria olida]
MADRPRYTTPQLKKYFDRISFSSSDFQFDVTRLDPAAQLHWLIELQRHQLVKVPFENLTLHYSWHRTVDVSPDHLYDKIVGEQRGGYCMENNTFFHTVLLSLGYDVYMAGARVYDPASSKYGGLSHCLNIVTIRGVRYAVDVGFGSRCPLRPLNLSDGAEHHMDMGSMRLRHDGIPQTLSRDQKVWIYEYRSSEGADWVPQYCFMDFEFLPEDIRVMNWSPARSPSSFFTYKVVCVRFHTTSAYIEDEGGHVKDDGKGTISGKAVLDGSTFKWHRLGHPVSEVELDSENGRLELLKRYFGIALTEENRRAIRGTAGAIAP